MSKVLGYKAKWDMDTHTGHIELKIFAGSPSNPHAYSISTLLPQNPAEMSMLVDLLRNEEPLEYALSTKELSLGEWEADGEGES